MNTIRSTCPLCLAFLLGACDPMSYREYRMEPYTGALAWEEVTRKADWSNRQDHAAVVFDGKMWIFGGYDPGRLSGDSYMEDVWNSSNGKDWTLVTEDAPWKGRRGHTVTLFDDGSGEALYLVGGFEVDGETGYRQYTNDVWRSPDGEQWERIKERAYSPDQMDTDFMPRFNHACVAANHGGVNYLYLIGGATMLEDSTGFYAFRYFQDVWRSGNGMDWVRLDNDAFGGRSGHAAFTDPATGRIYMHGGNHGLDFVNEEAPGQTGEEFYSVWYTDDGINWTADVTFTLERAGHGFIQYDDALWLFPGKENDYLQLRFAEEGLYYTYTCPVGGGWTLDSEGSAFSARHSYATVIFDGRVWVMGGETADNGPDNDVWSGKMNP